MNLSIGGNLKCSEKSLNSNSIINLICKEKKNMEHYLPFHNCGYQNLHSEHFYEKLHLMQWSPATIHAMQKLHIPFGAKLKDNI